MSQRAWHVGRTNIIEQRNWVSYSIKARHNWFYLFFCISFPGWLCISIRCRLQDASSFLWMYKNILTNYEFIKTCCHQPPKKLWAHAWKPGEGKEISSWMNQLMMVVTAYSTHRCFCLGLGTISRTPNLILNYPNPIYMIIILGRKLRNPNLIRVLTHSTWTLLNTQ